MPLASKYMETVIWYVGSKKFKVRQIKKFLRSESDTYLYCLGFYKLNPFQYWIKMFWYLDLAKVGDEIKGGRKEGYYLLRGSDASTGLGTSVGTPRPYSFTAVTLK